MYLFFDNVPSNPTTEILKLKLQSPWCSPVQLIEIGLLLFSRGKLSINKARERKKQTNSQVGQSTKKKTRVIHLYLKKSFNTFKGFLGEGDGCLYSNLSHCLMLGKSGLRFKRVKLK